MLGIVLELREVLHGRVPLPWYRHQMLYSLPSRLEAGVEVLEVEVEVIEVDLGHQGWRPSTSQPS